MDYKEFAKSIKQKYPEYQAVEDLALAKSFVDKNPAYKDQVNFPKGTGLRQFASGLRQSATRAFTFPGRVIEKQLISRLDPNRATIGEDIVTATTPVTAGQKAGKVTGDIAQFFTPSGAGGRVTAGVAGFRGAGLARAGINAGIDTAQGIGLASAQQDRFAPEGALLGFGLGVGARTLPTVVAGARALRNRALRFTDEVSNPDKIMTRVARVNPNELVKFNQLSKGETTGEYLVNRNIFGNREEMVEKLAYRFNTYRNKSDEALQRIDEIYKVTHKPKSMVDVLDLLEEQAKKESGSVVKSPYLARVQELKNKYETQGLTMTEINEAKRLFERNVKLNFLKTNNPANINKANNLDIALRDEQFQIAKDLGLQNLDELNRETMLAKNLGDALFKQMTKQEANNVIGLTDALVLTQGNPGLALAQYGFKKTFQDRKVRSNMARWLARNRVTTQADIDIILGESGQLRLPAGQTQVPTTINQNAVQAFSDSDVMTGITREGKRLK